MQIWATVNLKNIDISGFNITLKNCFIDTGTQLDFNEAGFLCRICTSAGIVSIAN